MTQPHPPNRPRKADLVGWTLPGSVGPMGWVKGWYFPWCAFAVGVYISGQRGSKPEPPRNGTHRLHRFDDANPCKSAHARTRRYLVYMRPPTPRPDHGSIHGSYPVNLGCYRERPSTRTHTFRPGRPKLGVRIPGSGVKIERWMATSIARWTSPRPQMDPFRGQI